MMCIYIYIHIYLSFIFSLPYSILETNISKWWNFTVSHPLSTSDPIPWNLRRHVRQTFRWSAWQFHQKWIHQNDFYIWCGTSTSYSNISKIITFSWKEFLSHCDFLPPDRCQETSTCTPGPPCAKHCPFFTHFLRCQTYRAGSKPFQWKHDFLQETIRWMLSFHETLE